jgi:predicted nuclease of predicted toxin-antitoxin system
VRFLLDESADLPLATHLEALGHDVTAIVRDHPRALADEQVLEIALREQRILITNDREFGELVFRQGLSHTGIILFRLGAEDLATKTAWLDRALSEHAGRLAEFLVITDHGIRIRGTTTGPD